MPLSDHHISIILLAAGLGTRMGEERGPKLLLPVGDGRAIVRHAAEGAVALGPEELVVVVRPDLPKIEAALAGLPLRCVPNHRFAEGMGTSIAVGARSLANETEAAFVMLGDEPVVSWQVVDGLLDAYLRERKAVTMPVYGGQPGPPTLFSRSLFGELSGLEGDVGGRQLVAGRPELVCRVHFAEEERPRDVDTPEDYDALAGQT